MDYIIIVGRMKDKNVIFVDSLKEVKAKVAELVKSDPEVHIAVCYLEVFWSGTPSEVIENI